jgi:antitoxin ParD1/3/4
MLEPSFGDHGLELYRNEGGSNVLDIKDWQSLISRLKLENRSISMNVSLTTELEKFVSAKVESGRYNSASEVVREALRLRLLEEYDHARSVRLAGFNEELGRRLDTLDRGQHVSPSDARARLKRKSEQRRKARA